MRPPRARRARRGRPARAGLCELRRLPRLRGARRALPRARERCDERPELTGPAMSGATRALRGRLARRAGARRAPRRRGAPARVLAAAHRDALPARLRGRDGVQRQLDDLAARPDRRRRLLPEAHPALRRHRACSPMHVLSRRGLSVVRAPDAAHARSARFALLLAVMVPGVGAQANGAQRWIVAGPIQIQPSEIAKVALILYGAHLLAPRPQMTSRTSRTMVPYLRGQRRGLRADPRRARSRHGAGRRSLGRRRCWSPRGAQAPPPGAGRGGDRGRRAARDR